MNGFFSLVDSSCYQEIKQSCEQWNIGYQLAELLYIPETTTVYLAAAHVKEGRLQQICWSFESIKLNQVPGQLVVRGRFGDTIYLEVEGGTTSLEPDSYNPNDPDNPFEIYDEQVIKPGFRFDLVTQQAVVIPQLDEIIPYLSDGNTPPLQYHFLYFDEGAPPIPKQAHGISLLVGEHLQSNCKFAAAKDWLDLSLPLNGGNLGWQRYQGDQPIAPDESDARRRRLLFAHLENLQAWLKHLHQKNSTESINQARQLLNLIESWLGQRPLTVNKPWEEAVTLDSFEGMPSRLSPMLLCYFDSFSDTKLLLEHCVSVNRRSCSNSHSTYDESNCAPITCFSLLEICLLRSPYRLNALFRYAKEYIGQLNALGDALLSAFEKGENETLSMIRENQAIHIQHLSLKLKENLAIEAKFNVDAAQKALEIARHQLMYYQGLLNVGLIPEEEDNITLLENAMVSQAISQGLHALAQGWMLIPEIMVGIAAHSDVGGGTKIAKSFEGGAAVASTIGSIQSAKANLKSIDANYIRRAQEWTNQKERLTIEVKQLEIQLLAAKRRFAVASQELDIHRLQLDHSQQTLQFLKDKFTGEEFYHWQRQELKKIFHDCYQCCLYLALQTEKACNEEQGYTNQRWLNIPFWNDFYEGLMSGRKLNMAHPKNGTTIHDSKPSSL